MSSVAYIRGDATRPLGDGPMVIAHCCNDAGAWGAGFVLGLSKRWTRPEQEYRALKDRRLGDVQLVQVEPGVEVANIIGQVLHSRMGPPIRYAAIQAGFEKIAARRPEASVHMPRIGCGLAGGHWPIMSEIIHTSLCAKGIHVTVYDL